MVLNVGAGAYYWLSDSGLGGVYNGESLLRSDYSPNAMGQAYINAYNGATRSIPTPTATPSLAPQEKATAIPAPQWLHLQRLQLHQPLCQQ